MEVLFTGKHGRNKNATYLVAVKYQSNSNESDKLSRLDGFEVIII